jgi:hypothetical protein
LYLVLAYYDHGQAWHNRRVPVETEMANESGITVAITIIQGRQFVPRQTASNSPPVVKLTHAAIVMGMFTQL